MVAFKHLRGIKNRAMMWIMQRFIYAITAFKGYTETTTRLMDLNNKNMSKRALV